MRFIDAFRQAWADAAPAKSSQPRPLTEADTEAWWQAQDERITQVPPLTIAKTRRLLRNRNAVRWWSLQRDFRWLQKEMRKMGLNPEDARYML